MTIKDQMGLPASSPNHMRRLALVAALLTAACSPWNDSSSGSADPDADTGSGFAVGGGSGLFEVAGPEGGPFEGDQRIYELVNTSTSRTVTWEVDALPWLTFSDQGGMLGPGASTEVTATLISEVAEALAEGDYPADIVFRDSNTSAGDIYLAFLLRVLPPSDDTPLWVSPETSVQVSGEVGGSLSESTISYTVQNIGEETLDWAVSLDQPWLLMPGIGSGSLEAGASTEVLLGLDPAVTSYLLAGTHVGRAHFDVTSNPESPGLDREIELDLTEPGGGGRVEEGLVALYDFEQPAAVVQDQSGVQPGHNLSIEDPEAVQWLPGVLRIEQPTRLVSAGPAKQIVDACKATNAITLEAWITPLNVEQDGPARIATISDGAYQRDVTLGQGLWNDQPSDTYTVRLRSTETDDNGLPAVSTPAGSAQVGLQHVVYVRTPEGGARVYVDGVLVVEGMVDGDLSNWNDGHQLALANEISAARPWLGDLHLVAIYERALSAAEVEQNFDAGTGDDLAGSLGVDPNSPFVITGVEGGSFSPTEKAYTLSNSGPEEIQWSVAVSEPWIYADAVGGILEPSAETTVTVYLDQEKALTFSPGSYTAAVELTNLTNGMGSTTREVLLTVESGDGDGDGGDGDGGDGDGDGDGGDGDGDGDGGDGDGGGGDGEKPSPFNTGWRVNIAESDLQSVYGTYTVSSPGVYENFKFYGRVKILSDDITFRNCWFHPTGGGSSPVILNNTNFIRLRFEYCEMDQEDMTPGTNGSFIEATGSGSDYSVYIGHSYFHDFWTDILGLSRNSICEYSYFTRWELAQVILGGDPHGDSQQTSDLSASNVRFYRNTFYLPWGVGGFTPNASFQCAGKGEYSPGVPHYQDKIVIEENWINGGNYMLRLVAKNNGLVKNCRIVGNKFGRDFNNGCGDIGASSGGSWVNNEVGGNVWEDTGEPVSNGDAGGFSQNWE